MITNEKKAKILEPILKYLPFMTDKNRNCWIETVGTTTNITNPTIQDHIAALNVALEDNLLTEREIYQLSRFVEKLVEKETVPINYTHISNGWKIHLASGLTESDFRDLECEAITGSPRNSVFKLTSTIRVDDTCITYTNLMYGAIDLLLLKTNQKDNVQKYLENSLVRKEVEKKLVTSFGYLGSFRFFGSEYKPLTKNGLNEKHAMFRFLSRRNPLIRLTEKCSILKIGSISLQKGDISLELGQFLVAYDDYIFLSYAGIDTNRILKDAHYKKVAEKMFTIVPLFKSKFVGIISMDTPQILFPSLPTILTERPTYVKSIIVD